MASDKSVVPATVVMLVILCGTCLGQGLGRYGQRPDVSGRGPRYSIEKLTESEIKELMAAQQALTEAQGKLAAVELEIQRAHGQVSYMCDTSEKIVTFFGDYALITDQPKGGCISW